MLVGWLVGSSIVLISIYARLRPQISIEMCYMSHSKVSPIYWTVDRITGISITNELCFCMIKSIEKNVKFQIQLPFGIFS